MPLTRADAAHLCRRVGFAGTNAEIAHFRGREIADAVDEIIDTAVDVPGRPSWVDHHEWWKVYDRALAWWIGRMIRARWVTRSSSVPSPLVEKLTLFWHGHFASGIDKVEDMSAMFDQNQLFRRHALGDFDRLVRTVSLNGAVLRYIDNDTNVKGEEQENFARELMELHTIGVGEFSEDDVIAMARAWTGHNIVGWSGDHMDATYRYYPERHDTGSKSLFAGQLAPRAWNGPDTITVLTRGVKQQATARFLVRKLWLYFVDSAPPQAAVDELAGVLAANGMVIGEVLRALFKRPEFWAPQARWALVRSPTEFAVDLLRRTGVPPAEAGLTWLMPGMGQRLFEPPDVAGWGTHDYWISTATSWGKGRFVGQLRWNERVQSLFEGIENDGRAAAVDRILTTLGIDEPTPATVNRVGQWYDATLARHRWAAKYNAVIIGAMTPEFQVA